MKQFSRMASGITEKLNFTYDLPENNPNGRMPVLDTQIWVGREERETGIPKEILPEHLNTAKTGKLNNVILYSFYKKNMANRVPNRQESAAPDGQKFSTVSQEIIRRCKNTSRDLDPRELEETIKEYMDELIAGKFSREFRIKVLKSAMTGFLRMWELEVKGEGKINRPEKSSRQKRRWGKLCGKQQWFKQQGGKQKGPLFKTTNKKKELNMEKTSDSKCLCQKRGNTWIKSWGVSSNHAVEGKEPMFPNPTLDWRVGTD